MKVAKLKTLLLVLVVAAIVAVVYYFLNGRGYVETDVFFVVANICFFALFFLFIPYRKKMSRLPGGVYLAFVVALFMEMYGLPLTMYVFMGVFGYQDIFSLDFLLRGVLGDDLFFFIFRWVIWPLTTVVVVAGALLIIFGWSRIYRGKGKGQLVTTGIYARVRHPQYLGFLLLTLGMLFEWPTIFTLALWPFLALLYYRLARTEEKEAEAEFGEEFRAYKRRVPMFIPRLRVKKPAAYRKIEKA